MIFTDTHAHLYSKEFDKDRDEVLQKALERDVKRFFIPAIDSSHTAAMYELEQRDPDNIFLMMGLHPSSVDEHYEKELQHVKEELERRKFYAVGEIGIDLYWEKKFLKQQQDAFERQIQLAKEHSLPIVIHCREAFDEIFEILETEKDEKLFGIFHCFTGDIQQAKRAISFNMKLGIGGVVTFKNSGLDKFIAEIPLENIVLETDAPYLAPAPYRGKRNESSYIRIIAEKLASLYEVEPEEIARVTTQNSRDIFGV
ncbi:TatD family deoxyribonuclease [Antarcticibacterium flavum]|uniref:TatD family deoxyribonuclease n=1 Tax=Antarcticibacterium flavum TaxID=2058175 RepID=A0A5B7X318_9FLAO|nr:MULTISPECIES: TatD family hydrolase [Antarcticibacterium]MCM4159457.1 hydrolase TatD [Antarcticibacterium sp. W02-3]QCY69906.1 TatD family deoxyribonuclease [Antarcticibacterium flavum]